MIANVHEFKGHPILVLSKKEDDKFPFRFGVSKAKLILEHLEDIKKFVADNDENGE